MSIEIDIKWFDGTIEEANKRALQGLKICSEAILGEAKNEAPVLTGTLMRSGSVNVDEVNKFVIISFSTPYALKMHETHRKKNKYLERPFLKYKNKAKYFIERELEK